MESKKPQQKRYKQPTSFRLSEQALELLAALAEDTGQSQAGVVELALRDLAKARGITEKKQS